jgi:C4-dicarboxylate-specific signal transduction histidine kinase
MGHLASALAHELNQPLGAILRNVDAAEIFLQGHSPDLGEIRTILADIRADDQRAGRVIDHMRSLLKRRAVELQPLNLNDVLAESVSLARADARVRRVSLVVDLPAKPLMVRGDRVHLQQVLLNLVLNGMDAMVKIPPAARVLTIRAEVLNNGGVEAAVGDCGAGISADNMKQIFKPFFTTKASGMGMGLSICQTIIEAHGGKIEAMNNPERGATFKILLPAAKA